MKSNGFTILEVILAMAVFITFSTASVMVILQSYNANRLGEEMTVANQFAAEGLEAVRSVKNQNYNNLLNTLGTGVNRSPGGVWYFTGPNDTLTHNSSDEYIRTVKVEDVQRDPDGNIVSSGTLDSDTKKITSEVTWNFNSARAESLSLVTYLTNWRKQLGDGILVYSEGTITPPFRSFDNVSNTFTSEVLTPDSINGLNFTIKTSPNKREAIAGWTNSSGTLQVMCYDGDVWSNEWSVNVGGTGTTKRFDIAYETNSGSVVVLYSTNASGSNELAYRVKPGDLTCGSFSWYGATSLSSARTSGVVQWVKMAEDRRATSNLIAASWADANRDLSAAIWSGSFWTNEPTTLLEAALEIASTAQDVDSFDIGYESSSGNVMLVWGSGGSGTSNGAYFTRCSGGTASCSWGSRTAISGLANDATNLDLTANPDTNEMMFASIGNGGSDLQAAYWSGSSWTGSNDIDTSAQTPASGTKLVATGWLINGGVTRSIIVYNNSSDTELFGFLGNGGSFSRPPGTNDNRPWFIPSPLFANPQRWYDIQMDPLNKGKLMFLVSDNSSDLFAKRLTMDGSANFSWADSDGGSALETNLSQALRSPFSFAYWRSP